MAERAVSKARAAGKPKTRATPAKRATPRPSRKPVAPPAPEPEPVIATAGLTKVYPNGVKAVDGLDLRVRPGEIFGLLGPNGAGKTTTVGMLTTRVVPTSGRAVIDGMDVWSQPAVAKQIIGVVAQTNTLDRGLSAWENLYFHGRYFGMSARAARQAADRALEQFRLSERRDAAVMELSGGMAQRLMVARSILHRPRVLFLDEPTAGLDPQSRIAMWEILSELHAAGQTVLLTTHYMEEADQLCDRVAIMDHGRILALDTPEALKRGAGADTVVSVTARGDQEALSKHLTKLRGVTKAIAADGVVRAFMRGHEGVVPKLIAHAEKGGFAVSDVSVTEPTLETVFINLTGKDLRE